MGLVNETGETGPFGCKSKSIGQVLGGIGGRGRARGRVSREIGGTDDISSGNGWAWCTISCSRIVWMIIVSGLTARAKI